MDEIHTYVDTTGAQTAMVIRRWRHAIGMPVRCVGLSATLRDATDFFAQLTGLSPNSITEVTPQQDELEYLSMEYQFVLRGDPVSQTSLLSTSIQAAFLLGRILERNSSQGSQSGGRFGQRLFAFTDDLDIINRFYDDLRDAEGYNLYGNPTAHLPLASLRATDSTKYSIVENKSREAQGQIWKLCQDLNRSLSNPLKISRTSSQDVGVSTSSDIVVATSALEVGYNDLGVGAVLQHKSPYEMASYVQRKGRAGRNLRMRPIMVTVLSDYGRDRLTFQSYDQLFDPMLPPQHLPIQNHYILRMHATLAFIDWLTGLIKSKAWCWQILNGPAFKYKQHQKEVRTIISKLMSNENNIRQDLEDHIEKSLRISHETVQLLLWEPPRSLMFEVLPTLDRRLATEWVIDNDAQLKDLSVTPPTIHPLPDFIAANLFSDLCLPEVIIHIPPIRKSGDTRQEVMPIIQALRQFAPGRVTRRFGNEQGELSHWIPVPVEQSEYSLSIDQFVPQYEFVSQVKVKINTDLVEMPCYRPWTIRVERTPDAIATTSNAFLMWESDISIHGKGLNYHIIHAGGWESIIRQWTFFLHSQRSPVTVTRFAHSAIATVRLINSAEDKKIITHFTTSESDLAAIGFAQEVDAICVQFTLPATHILQDRIQKSTELQTWRVAYVHDLICKDEFITNVSNIFQANWLYQIYLSALIVRACNDNCTLQEAHQSLHNIDLSKALKEVMSSIFQINDNNLSDAQNTGKLAHTLSDLLAQEQIQERLKSLATELWAPNPSHWEQWLKMRLHETLGEILLQACIYCVPQQAGTETLLLDLGRVEVESDGSLTVETWITESTLGGLGVIEAIARTVSEEPGCLSRALTATITSDSLEVASINLDRYMNLLAIDPEIADATANVRNQYDHQQRDAKRKRLYQLLSRRGIYVDHTFSVALNYHLLRRDLNAASDNLIMDILNFWRQTEDSLGITMDLRVFAYVAISNPNLRQRIQDLITANVGSAPTDEMMIGVVSGLLWPRSVEIRSHVFASYSPFVEHSWTDATLVHELLLPDQLVLVRMGDNDWQSALIAELVEHHSVNLAVTQHDEAKLRSFLAEIIAMPINIDYLQFFPFIQRIDKKDDNTIITFAIQEVL